MNSPFQARAHARAIAVSVAVGAVLGLTLGGVYLASGAARAGVEHARTTRLALAASNGFSEQALMAEAGTMGPGALAVARRHDPFTVAGAPERDRRAALFATRLERTTQSPAAAGLIRATLTTSIAPFQAASSALQSARDFDCLSTAVYYEARGETPAGQAAVAQVVLNRARHPAFPKSVCGVVFQGSQGRGCQFSFACNGAMRARKEPAAWRRAQAVAARALDGYVMDQVGASTHFHATRVGPGWRGLVRVSQVGSHIFYRLGGRPAIGAYRPGRDGGVTLAQESVDRPIYARASRDASPGAEPTYTILGGRSADKPAAAPAAASAQAETKSEPTLKAAP